MRFIMKNRSIPVFFSCLLLPSLAFAFYIETGPASTVPHPTPALPPKLGMVTDPLFGTTIKRLTDIVKDIPGKTHVRTVYGTWDPVSNDDRYILLGVEPGGYTLWRADTGKYVKNMGRWLQYWNSQDPEPRWDRSGGQNSRIYYRQDMSLKWVDVETGATGTVRNFAADFPEFTAHYIYNGEEGSPSRDCRYWIFMVRNSKSPYHTPRVFTYDMKNNAILTVKDVSASGIDHVEVSPDGAWVEISYESNQSTYNIHLENASRVVTNTSSVHGNWAKSRQGHVGYVNFRSDGDYLEFIRADGGGRYRLLYSTDVNPWSPGGGQLHGLPANSPKDGWTFINNYVGQDNPANIVQCQNSLFGVEVDETKVHPTDSHFTGTKPRILRISFLHNFLDANLTGHYPKQPNAVTHQLSNGALLFSWGSNWRNSTLDDFTVLHVRLPATWWEDLGGVAGPLAITSPSTLPIAEQGNNFSYDMTATGGSGSYSWTASGLPAGLSMSNTSGVISGIPTVTGTYNANVTVAGGGQTVSQAVTLQIRHVPLPPSIIGISP